MTPEVQAILKLRVPIIVRLAHCKMTLKEVLDFGPGSIIELPKDSEEELEFMVQNMVIGAGEAVKVGENFGLEVTHVGGVKERIKAIAPVTRKEETKPMEDDEAADLAAQMLAGQL